MTMNLFRFGFGLYWNILLLFKKFSKKAVESTTNARK